MSNDRAARYRRLALSERDPERARILRLLADEAESGLLHSPSVKPLPENPPPATPLPAPNPPSGSYFRGH